MTAGWHGHVLTCCKVSYNAPHVLPYAVIAGWHGHVLTCCKSHTTRHLRVPSYQTTHLCFLISNHTSVFPHIKPHICVSAYHTQARIHIHTLTHPLTPSPLTPTPIPTPTPTEPTPVLTPTHLYAQPQQRPAQYSQRFPLGIPPRREGLWVVMLGAVVLERLGCV